MSDESGTVGDEPPHPIAIAANANDRSRPTFRNVIGPFLTNVNSIARRASSRASAPLRPGRSTYASQILGLGVLELGLEPVTALEVVAQLFGMVVVIRKRGQHLGQRQRARREEGLYLFRLVARRRPDGC